MTKTISYQQSTIVDRPAGEVWAYVADYDFDLEWRDGLTDMTPNPYGPPETGTTVHEELRSMGTTIVNDTTVTMTGDHAYRFVGSGTSGQVEGGRKVVAIDPGRSEFTYDINLTLNGPTSLLSPILRRVLRRKLGKDLQRFRSLVETGASTPELPGGTRQDPKRVDMSVSRAAMFSAGLFLLLGAFQAALVAGAPWGEASWGGQNRGALPTSLRIASFGSLVFALTMTAVVSGRLRVPFRRSRVFGALLVFFVVSVAMNAVSRSSVEQLIWVPYGLVQLATIWLARRQERSTHTARTTPPTHPPTRS